MKYKIVVGIIIFVFFVAIKTEARENIHGSKNDSVAYNWERFSVNLGGFLTTFNSDIQLGSRQLGLGININLEDALGLSTSNTVIRGDVEYSFGKKRRSSVSFGYFGFYRSSYKVLESEIEVGSSVFPIGTEVTSKSDVQIFRTNYTYSYYKDERIKLGVALGVFVMPTNFSISALNSSDEKAEFIAPLPVLGIRNIFQVTPNVLIKQNIEVFYLATSDFKGSMSDIVFLVEYNPFKHFGFGLGINIFRLNLSVYENSTFFNFEGTMKTGFTGLLFYGRYFF